MDAATAKKEADMSKKTSVKMGPWDVCKKVDPYNPFFLLNFSSFSTSAIRLQQIKVVQERFQEVSIIQGLSLSYADKKTKIFLSDH